MDEELKLALDDLARVELPTPEWEKQQTYVAIAELKLVVARLLDCREASRRSYSIPLKPLNFPTGIVGALNDVHSFHDRCGIPIGDSAEPKFPSEERVQLRFDLIREEFEELRAMLISFETKIYDGQEKVMLAKTPEGQRLQMCDVADGLVDLIYVCVGAALEFGIPLDAVWKEVQRANMSKADGPNRADGKQLKPEGWVPPDVDCAVFGGR